MGSEIQTRPEGRIDISRDLRDTFLCLGEPFGEARYCAEMSQTVPIQDAYQAINDLDADALIAVCHPSISFESRITALEESVYEGYDGVRRYIANIAAAFDSVEVEPFDVMSDADCAVVPTRYRAHGRGSGVTVGDLFFVAARARARVT